MKKKVIQKSKRWGGNSGFCKPPLIGLDVEGHVEAMQATTSTWINGVWGGGRRQIYAVGQQEGEDAWAHGEEEGAAMEGQGCPCTVRKHATKDADQRRKLWI